MAVTLNASTTAGLVQTADTSGNLSLQSGGTTILALTSAGAAVTGTLSATTGAAVGGATAGAGGVAFPATAVAVANANTLDDYEEGTWTPSQGSGLTVVGAFSSSGMYVKIGNQVTVQAVVTGATSIACSNGGQIFTGLPFSMSGIAIGSESDNANTSGHTVFCFTTLCYNNYAAIAAVTTIYVSVTYIV